MNPIISVAHLQNPRETLKNEILDAEEALQDGDHNELGHSLGRIRHLKIAKFKIPNKKIDRVFMLDKFLKIFRNSLLEGDM